MLAKPLSIALLVAAAIVEKHRLAGLASYYSPSLDGARTASGEIFRNSKLTAAHRTLPLGTWVEVTSKATGRKVRVRINDRGPYAKKFVIDLSQSAARAIGIDAAADRSVSIRIIALPGEDPLPEDVLAVPKSGVMSQASGVRRQASRVSWVGCQLADTTLLRLTPENRHLRPDT